MQTAMHFTVQSSIVYTIVYKITQVQDTHIINVVYEIEIHRYIIYIDYY